MTRRFDLIAFDWDGTLFDSTAAIALSIQDAVRDVGGTVPSLDVAKYVIGMSLQSALKEDPDYRGLIERGTPLGVIAPASELVETVQYLASDASAFMTGQILTVDGGRCLVDAVSAPAH